VKGGGLSPELAGKRDYPDAEGATQDGAVRGWRKRERKKNFKKVQFYPENILAVGIKRRGGQER